MTAPTPSGALGHLKARSGQFTVYRHGQHVDDNIGNVETLPYLIRVLLEAALRNVDGFVVNEEDVTNLANGNATAVKQAKVTFKPGRVVLQPFTGTPAIVENNLFSSARRGLSTLAKRLFDLFNNRGGVVYNGTARRTKRVRRSGSFMPTRAATRHNSPLYGICQSHADANG